MTTSGSIPNVPATTGFMAATPMAVSSLEAFDRIERGDRAPEWVIQGVVAAWGLPAKTVVTLIVLSENVTFKVSVDGEARMVVRLGRPGYAASVDVIRSELNWIEALQSHAHIPTPSPVRGQDGELVQALHGRGGETWTAVAFGFVPGVILEEKTDLIGHFAGIGQITARMHRHARSWKPPVGFDRFSWDLDALVGPDARWGHWGDADINARQRGLLQSAETAARVVLRDAGVDSSPQHFGLIHGDLRPSNVMTHGGEMSIIDFDDCGFGFYLYDFAAALTFYEHRDDAPAMAREWLNGYRSVDALSDEDVTVACAFSMIRRLTMLGWATTHLPSALPADLWAENLPGTIEVADRFLQNRTWLAKPRP